ncbi:MAG: phosphodiester glycosidase family protein [Sporichthyaceae bacterium]
MSPRPPGHPLRTAAALALALLATTASSVDAADPIRLAGCAPGESLLASTPVARYDLPRSATARVWDTGRRSQVYREVRIGAVVIPRQSLVPQVLTPSTLTSLARPGELARKRTVAFLNGAVFDTYGIPTKSSMAGGVLRKADSTPRRTLAVYAAARKAAIAQASVAGSAVITRGRTTVGTLRIGAVNSRSLPRAKAGMFTSAWGALSHSVGNRTVVVAGGKVVDILGVTGATRGPGSGRVFLTARGGSTASALLSKARVGDRVVLRVAPAGKLRQEKKSTPIGSPTGLLGLSAVLVQDGKNVAGCDPRSELRRPRSVIGWRKNGDVLLVAISGRDSSYSGIRLGGASLHQTGNYLRRLGAVTAAILDGGNSTTLLIRTKVGGPLIRLDRASATDYQRAIADAVGFAVP